MTAENFGKQFTWLSSRYYIYFEVSPTRMSIVELYDIDKFGNPIISTKRIYRGESITTAIKKAYEQEFQKLAKS